MDPLPDELQQGKATSRIAADVLWSDPGDAPGFISSERGIGTCHGPDVLQTFFDASPGLHLIIRSHEGPDSRDALLCPERARAFPSLRDGFSIDQKVNGGSLVTVFSAPNYPQHEGSNNNASIIILNGPRFHESYSIVNYNEASRPHAECYYDIDDEDLALTEPADNDGAVLSESNGCEITSTAIA